MNDPAEPPTHLRWMLLVLAVVFGLYAPSLGNGYALDDQLVAKAVRHDGRVNTMVSELRPIGEYFSTNYWEGNGRQSHLFRPITVLSYAATNAAQGPPTATPKAGAFAHHLINLLLHGWATWLVFALARPFVANPLAAVVGAAIFGVHAIHSEVVAGVVGRAELFAFCFGAQSLVTVHGAVARGGTIGIGRTILAALAVFAAIASKESAFAWLPFAPLYFLAARWHADRSAPIGATLRPHAIPLAAITLVPAAVFLALRAGALADMPVSGDIAYTSNPLVWVDAGTRICSAIAIWGYGLYKTLFPLHLACDYGPVTFDLIDTPFDLRVLGAGGVLLAIGIGGLACARRAPLLFLAAVTFLGFSAITANVLLGIGTIFGERLYYTPSLALSFVVAWAWTRAGRGRLPLALALAAWSGMCAWVVVERNGVWENNRALFLSDAEANDRAVRILDYAGDILYGSGDPESLRKAEAYWQRAITLDPEHAPALINYGTFLGMRGRVAEAEALLRRALQAPAHRRTNDAFAFNNLGLACLNTSRPDEAFEYLRRSQQLDPASLRVYEPLLGLAPTRLSARSIEAILERGERALPGHPSWAQHRARLAALVRDGGAISPAIEAGLEAAWKRQRAGDRDGAREAYRALLDGALPAAVRQEVAQRVERLGG